MRYMVMHYPDGETAGNGEEAVSEKGNKVVLKYKGEVDRELDITNPEDLKTFTRLAEKGRYFEKNEETLMHKVKAADNWENRLRAIKEGKEDPDIFVGDLERILGRKLTKVEKDQIDDGDFDEDSRMYKQFEDKIKDLENRLEKTNQDTLARDIQRTFDRLSAQYKGDEIYPAFDPQEVDNFVQRRGLYNDNVGQLYEDAYFLMHKDTISKNLRESAGRQAKNQQRKRENVPLNNGNGSRADLKLPAYTKGESYSSLAEKAAAGMRETGASLFIDD